ncbi:Histone-lysine N-methyltransferase setd3 [Chlorella sorokiniana]|uniref:Histone-lysine N-methyltransferase setd3 n=1 Tax=Chlorella sorokiniana TaxID=3076 RepID=A0A2P6TJW3_CHLSO|nr:Histone-lysine N-methyltransferase setd3 [Chlorella sorokiniana]|eukprot:PRW44382.1 Histone-lysine N-methyltransferase setd3 [Chlorella sorokiniana]
MHLQGCVRQARRTPRLAVATAAAGPEAAPQQQESALQPFLRWAIANGVEGVGAADSKIALYEGEGGERGVVALQPIPSGQVVMRIPLRLAITDQVDDDDDADAQQAQQAQQERELPWSVRLAGRLLAKAAEGDACPWAPYLAVLPQQVPSPLTAFSWEDVQALEYQPMLRQLEHTTWLASSAGQQPGGSRFSREQWDWALSVVHSRTFGAPGPAGGVGVRMLVPLVDMLNHAGDFILSPPGSSNSAEGGPSVQAFENVRWDLRAPAGPEGEWAMEVAATRDISAGEEVLLSYGERGNDDFLLHYGFVPPRNPHDDVTLFTDIESAIDWWMDTFLPLGALPPERLQAAINSAYTSAEEQDSSAMAAERVLAAAPEAEAEIIRAELARIKLSAGGMVDGRLLAAFRSLYEAAAPALQQQQQGSSSSSSSNASSSSSSSSNASSSSSSSSNASSSSSSPAPLGGSWLEHLRRAVARRCQEVLAGMATPLLQDLERLAAWERHSGDAPHSWAAALTHYAAAIAAYEARCGGLLGAAAASGGSAAGASAEMAAVASSSGQPLLDAGAAGGQDAALAALLLQQARQAEQEQHKGSAASGGSELQSESSTSGTSILPVIYRAYKKLILADAILLAD